MVRPSVSVFLSVFQGSAFVEEQLESLKRQQEVELSLYFHSDDEDSSTIALIHKTGMRVEQVKLNSGLGVPRAYFELQRSTFEPTDLYAFCDQDDVWDPKKLTRAAIAMENMSDIPTMWVCRIRPFTECAGVRKYGDTYPHYVPDPSFGNALVETIGPGCAMVWNHALHEILTDGESPSGVLMHDTWLYLVASAFGQVLVEPEVFVDYRIHDANAVGMRRNLFVRVRRLSQVLRNPFIPTLESQATAFRKLYGKRLAASELDALNALLDKGRTGRVAAWRAGVLFRQSRFDNLQLLPRLLVNAGGKNPNL